MNRKVIGIDFGTSTIKISQNGAGIVLSEKNVIAILKKTEVIAVGNEAYEMYEKAPSNIDVSYPVRNGVIADLSNMHELMLKLLEMVIKNPKHKLKGFDYYLAIPTDITEVEKRSYSDVIVSPKLRPGHIKMVEKPVADALGMGLDILDSTGVLIMDFGANTTDISVLSLGGIIFSKLVPLGGKELDQDIINLARRKYNFVIGEKTAEAVKKEIGSATEYEGTMTVYGRNALSGLPSELIIDASEVNEAITEHLQSIVDNVKVILERTPPEVSADIYKNGIYITGGSSKLRNLADFVTKATNLKVNFSDDPENTVIAGLNTIMENSHYSKIVSDLI